MNRGATADQTRRCRDEVLLAIGAAQGLNQALSGHPRAHQPPCREQPTKNLFRLTGGNAREAAGYGRRVTSIAKTAGGKVAKERPVDDEHL